MGTHGFRFHPQIQVFSLGKAENNQEPYDPDFYDDAILQFDRDVGKILQALQDEGLYDRTIIIIGSDHGEQFNARERVPLIIHFPNGEYARRINPNVENIDIAPTILDYMGAVIPEWMDGVSLLHDDPQNKPITSFNATGATPEAGEPPFYQFYSMNVIYCDRWYHVNLRLKQMSDGLVDGSTAACPEAVLPSYDQVFSWMSSHLETYGFDVSSLK
jgi:arylsulfatase A-like enzyme